MNEELFIKCMRVIHSCNHRDQMGVSFHYIKLAGKAFNDNNTSFRRLAKEWNYKLQSLRNAK